MTSTREYYFNGKTVWYNNGNEYPGGIYVDTINPYSTGNPVFFPGKVSVNTLQPYTSGTQITVGSGQQWAYAAYNSSSGNNQIANNLSTPNTISVPVSLTAQNGFTNATSGPKFTYTGTLTKQFMVTGTYTAWSTQSSTILSIYVFHNGSYIAQSKGSTLTAATSPSSSTPCNLYTQACITLAPNDFVQLGFSIDSGTNYAMEILTASLQIECCDNN